MNVKLWTSLGLAFAIAVAPTFVAPTSAFGADAAADELKEESHMGTLVSASDSEFTMKADDGEVHKHTVAADAQVMDANGEPCKITDLKAGQKIRVTTKEGNAGIAVKVEAVA